jgi:peptidoglycan/xylan/chitin deacetylase (PgdA/CDA1 family)
MKKALSVPVLMYHHVSSHKGALVTITPENFESHIKYLTDEGYKTLTLEEFAQFKKGELELPKKSVLITFDDGWIDNRLVAYQILKKYGAKAAIFVVTDWVERASEGKRASDDIYIPNHREGKKLAYEEPSAAVVNWDDLVSMSDVFSVGSHSNAHDNEELGMDEWRDDLAFSKALIKNRLGFESKHLCWPRGNYTEGLVDLAQSLGFETLYTTKRGVNLADGDTSEIKRISVKDKDAKWLKSALRLYSSPILGGLYARFKR